MKNTLDKVTQIEKAMLSLHGLSIGDAFGQKFFIPTHQAIKQISLKKLPEPIWYYTDDTIMAISIVKTLIENDSINQDYLANEFTKMYSLDPNRGYGGTAHKILREMGQGIHWKISSKNAFDGMGSMGNGGAMRAAPIGAYFYEDYEKVVKEATASAEITHSHLEGQSGAVAVAIAASYMINYSNNKGINNLFEIVIDFLPNSETRSKIIRAKDLNRDTSLTTLVNRLGNGIQLCSFDTVPIALWFVNHFHQSYEDALWNAIRVLGDRDTICAIVGSIVSLYSSIPDQWVTMTEKLPKL